MPKIDLIHTGVPGLDSVLGGGLPSLSFTVVAGDPGAGKTTLAQQILFANATEEQPGLFLTVVGEPPMKMLRYQQQYDWFDVEKVGRSVHFQNFTNQVLEGDMDGVLESLVSEVERLEPAFVVVDSFRSITRMVDDDGLAGRHTLQHFVQRLSNLMTRWEATTFLLAEFKPEETSSNPIFTVADGVLWLRQVRDNDTRIRKVEVAKIRGQAELAGQHIYRITSNGIRVYPRALADLADAGLAKLSKRVGSGIPGLDGMMSGGFVRGDAAIVSGPSGSGKSVMCMQFAGAGLTAGENVVVATFEEAIEKYTARARMLGFDFLAAEEEGRLRIIRRRPLDLAVDETFEEVRDLVEEIGASRVVIDSLSGLEVAAHGAQAERLRESMGRMVHTLTQGGVTVLMTAELNQRMDMLRFTPHNSSFLADDVILQRYVEVRGALETVMSVVKMRRSGHSRAFRRYEITEQGIVVGDEMENLHGILTGVPQVKEGEPRAPGEWGGTDRPQDRG